MSEFQVTAEMRQFILDELGRKEGQNKDLARGVHADRDGLRTAFRTRFGQGFAATVDVLSRAPYEQVVPFPVGYVGHILYLRETYEKLKRQHGNDLTQVVYAIWRPARTGKAA